MSDPHPHYGAQQPPYGPPPGGVPPYGPQPPHGGAYYPGHGPPPTPYPYTYVRPEHQPPAGSTITALVISVLLVPMCMGNITPLIGTVMAGIALSERSRDPDRHGKFRRYAWISNGIHLGIFAVLAGLITTAIVLDV
ncbi:hypothetical protein [Nocardiopsis xinjiangensis]|uniref:hypothetical protein n=1 Tax=Nocardiopsis xinjiangensis TaxID=124285 RepID=UPI0003479422|nr:hypothetical protein [Nocardiopsis xinjiangensis]